ncbi:hypothetical protein GCK72_015885 [Caenorhabditis remanei]|uniref:Uncharacterized protein n=1 Tax=Caenorhabditis remanei TaxID=31234 RepID=A0A6A5GVC1_CAERE|nr:hypothetical protein GCK72_015885 [Caenorhabditis remanei]KAF1759418.1 hypothetical protein GCK72_015885 [Caenorhabditis remanei]
MSTNENCTVQNCYQCLTNRFWKMHDVFLNTSVRLINCENEKRQLEARLNEANAAIGNYKKNKEELESKLVASQEESALKILELQEQQELKMRTLELELSAVQKKSSEKIQELQEQHGKKLSGKDQEIQQLEIKLAVAKKEISEEELQEQLEEVSVKDTEMRDHVETPQSKEPTLHDIDLGKLYMEEAKKLQEALMAQLAAKDKEIGYLTEQHKGKLVAKDQEITNIREQHISKIVARDSEIQRLTEKVKNVDERNENQRKSICHFQQTIIANDQEIKALKERVTELEKDLEYYRDDEMDKNVMTKDPEFEAFMADWKAELENGKKIDNRRDGQTE